ncbi:prepilin-type N-terminal cleavage/methylation domain-containing protein [Thermomonas aquatica]|jgi:prepilin-type N-terminal cleavage/methylation domain-containing protein|uniref:Prepilin-type N-terminal cleavage/methylation domain-containing protein n=2 Tax=Thermomonas aquatica TaxID=2202149 RepID=A0A5B7ZQP6_9GAMM|nr:prepilin-type N-terminal cleavage/methylation domain-containing protein [Thermomonas aquatica]
MRHRGFTLLEMIVVLAILGLATALVAPSALRGIDSWRRRAELDSLLDQIRALPGNARASGRAIVLSDGALKSKDAPLRIASGWTLSVPTPWKVNANGVCLGGQVSIGNSYGSRTIVVAAPFCDPILRP